MPRSRKSQRAKRRARQEEKIHLGVLPIKRGDGKTLDVTPHIASWNIVTSGGYLALGEGFTIIEKDERASYMDKVREYQTYSEKEISGRANE